LIKMTFGSLRKSNVNGLRYNATQMQD